MTIPIYPETLPISLKMRSKLHKLFYNLNTGISEYTFAGLYLFRNKYNYKLSLLNNGDIAIFGIEDDKYFCMLPFGFPDRKANKDFFQKHNYFKGMSEPDTDKFRLPLENAGFCILEDRDNFDYLYERSNLVHLTGRKFHKKRNMVNAFINNYNYEEKYITHANVKDALDVLHKWEKKRIELGLSTVDCESAHEALVKMNKLELTGCITYVDGVPAAYSLGEPINRGKSFVVQFEKAIGDYKGIYQFINRSFASMINKNITCINREQDLGDPGLRQAKMSYRPDGFVKKYKIFSDPKYCICENCYKDS